MTSFGKRGGDGGSSGGVRARGMGSNSPKIQRRDQNEKESLKAYIDDQITQQVSVGLKNVVSLLFKKIEAVVEQKLALRVKEVEVDLTQTIEKMVNEKLSVSTLLNTNEVSI